MKKLVFAIALVLSTGNVFSASQEEPTGPDKARLIELGRMGYTRLTPEQKLEMNQLSFFIDGKLSRPEARELADYEALGGPAELNPEQAKRAYYLRNKATGIEVVR